ncbi:hypothetical protein [Prauserella cavernicola]|uniref:Uncharacterized protein n=1 Tax=Prauserella cavernicola TaxID=2800127 RepID=A0A934VA00_9PSEU|nr:hypothetical protein [Prauserella cavernicola]MBK1789388.1 hypothetical protein [Prauserella cavernicola]
MNVSGQTTSPTTLVEARMLALAYWADFGWPALVGPNGISLQIQDQQFAVSVPGDTGQPLFAALSDEPGAVFEIPVAHDLRWVFLVSGDGRATAAGRLPGADVALPGMTIPLPPTDLVHGRVRWIRSPEQDGQGLHSFDRFEEAVLRPRRQ